MAQLGMTRPAPQTPAPKRRRVRGSALVLRPPAPTPTAGG
eukprot:CAMPEP_0118944482 /NCGR_PEP_ID=MMETSP1169-20130426/40385_1 /TAXON_ID=36882 /ORGANISM="Pyramimonas obovata, Strain CCMP722" /LENGTH=39 /DNA_ID= /DNA_START= /DNA_END= /DNA_ORIENTATION=